MVLGHRSSVPPPVVGHLFSSSSLVSLERRRDLRIGVRKEKSSSAGSCFAVFLLLLLGWDRSDSGERKGRGKKLDTKVEKEKKNSTLLPSSPFSTTKHHARLPSRTSNSRSPSLPSSNRPSPRTADSTGGGARQSTSRSSSAACTLATSMQPRPGGSSMPWPSRGSPWTASGAISR
jgi:hypothetical protein